jgi:hypothetical protein
MLDILAIVERQLRPLAGRVGLMLTDDAASECSASDDLRQLEYRISLPDRRRLRLDVCHLVATRTITVEMWDPEDLVALAADASANTVAIGRRVWDYGHGDERDALAHEIVRQITAWIEGLR